MIQEKTSLLSEGRNLSTDYNSVDDGLEDYASVHSAPPPTYERVIKLSTSSFIWLFVWFSIPAISGMLYGYDVGAISSAFNPGAYQNHDLQSSFDLSDTGVEIVTSASLVGALFGSALSLIGGDFLSRRGVLITASGFYIGGALITGNERFLSISL